jgi:DNA/RNA-binding domain of Phe-tRNA-synthetase-like protein
MLAIEPHPDLDARVFVTNFPRPLGQLGADESVLRWLVIDADAPISPPENTKSVVRDLLRHGGYKPTGRGKPASEYLVRAVTESQLSTINLAVDVCNVVSLHSGLPISVVDFDLVTPPLRIGLAPVDSDYVFNATGQTIKLDGLLCLFDATGPCANAVKDSQRTKTSPATTRTLTIIWGTNKLPEHSEATEKWYHELLISAGAAIQDPSSAYSAGS